MIQSDGEARISKARHNTESRIRYKLVALQPYRQEEGEIAFQGVALRGRAHFWVR